MVTRNELLAVLVERYRRSERDEKQRILDEFVAVSGYHRKHAARLLRSAAPLKAQPSNRHRIYGEAVRAALIVLWEASDRVCGKRHRPLIPLLLEAMERQAMSTG